MFYTKSEGTSIPFDFLHLIQNLSHSLLFIILNLCRSSYVDLLTSLPFHENIICIASAPIHLVALVYSKHKNKAPVKVLVAWLVGYINTDS